jgi:hypothetical protein
MATTSSTYMTASGTLYHPVTVAIDGSQTWTSIFYLDSAGDIMYTEAANYWASNAGWSVPTVQVR